MLHSTVCRISAFFGLLLVTSICHAQYPCTDAGAFAVDTATVVQPLGFSGGGCQPKVVSAAASAWDVVVMFTSSGTPSLVIPVESVQFSGCDPDSLDNISTAVLFELIDLVSVRRSLDSGLIPTPSLGTSKYINVYQAGCVERTGSGDSTHFAAAGSGCCRKTFMVSNTYLIGVTITLVGSNGPDCGSGYNSTCEEDDILFSFLDN